MAYIPFWSITETFLLYSVLRCIVNSFCYSVVIEESEKCTAGILSILRNSRWRPRLPPFHDFRIVCPILVYLFNKVYMF